MILLQRYYSNATTPMQLLQCNYSSATTLQLTIQILRRNYSNAATPMLLLLMLHYYDAHSSAIDALHSPITNAAAAAADAAAEPGCSALALLSVNPNDIESSFGGAAVDRVLVAGRMVDIRRCLF